MIEKDKKGEVEQPLPSRTEKYRKKNKKESRIFFIVLLCLYFILPVIFIFWLVFVKEETPLSTSIGNIIGLEQKSEVDKNEEDKTENKENTSEFGECEMHDSTIVVSWEEYVVQAADTLELISIQFYETPDCAVHIWIANDLKSNSTLQENMVLKIPRFKKIVDAIN
ncbi:MAG: hypothetical protein ACRCWQ_10390 [Bacilli bacterium]